MPKKLNLIGKRFGKLVVTSEAPNANGMAGQTQWVCQCDCGNTAIVRTNQLNKGGTKSCGCINKITRNRKKDLIGERFGRLKVVALDHSNGNRYWLCKCDCGNQKVVASASLLQGKTQSCGCLQREKSCDAHLVHGGNHRGNVERLYHIYNGIKARCYDPNNRSWKWYGAKGVTMCNEWKNDYSKFREWAYANGYDENAPKWKHTCSIDRIDPYGNYEPSNCRWTDPKTQVANRRS